MGSIANYLFLVTRPVVLDYLLALYLAWDIVLVFVCYILKVGLIYICFVFKKMIVFIYFSFLTSFE